ncbi:DUF461 domain-containing protein [Streptomyces somaliensis]|uniref:DUF461 domain-containing protein n=1 Tax=Streptomyces somaliensis TaxID=78355 RepID=UPI0020CCD243|nr:DUF461 domain-containing protein [Streptomyces somaliensis]MCP9944312.1 DUF461 domain-containing protein [Streptomyces somaliensis]MCP9962447.1 DUF461 domain-containing protein [Streptomyces somaliensis]
MSRSLRRGALAATALMISLAPLTACGAGHDAQSLQIKPDNATTTVGDIEVLNALLITPAEGAEGPAVVSATLFNGGSKAETLEAVQLPGSDAKAELKPTGGAGPLTVPAGGSLILGGKGNASVVVRGLEESARGGAQDVVFRLSETGDVKLRALVHATGSYYDTFGPTPLPSSPAASPSGSPSTPPSGSPSGAPHASPGGSDAPTEPPTARAAATDARPSPRPRRARGGRGDVKGAPPVTPGGALHVVRTARPRRTGRARRSYGSNL